MRAAVVDVLAFLQLRRDCATIVGTLEQTSECKGVLPMFGFVSPRENILNLVKKLRCDQGLMSALVLDSLPHEISQIKPIFQDRLEI
jgi:hypothetical protein